MPRAVRIACSWEVIGTLFIRGRLVTGWNDPDIIGSVGLSYRMSDQASDVVDWYLQPTTPACHFPSRAAFRQAVMQRVTSQNHLVIQCTHRNHPNAYAIVMSGSRSTDEALANAAAGLQGTPPGHTWHHSEGVRFPNGFQGAAHCNMYLLQTWYHAGNPHAGGVAEYERAKGVRYQP